MGDAAEFSDLLNSEQVIRFGGRQGHFSKLSTLSHGDDLQVLLSAGKLARPGIFRGNYRRILALQIAPIKVGFAVPERGIRMTGLPDR
jgi:hypothetical protein